MSIPVFNFIPNYPVDHVLQREFITNDLGDGYHQTVTSEAAYTRSGGTGVVASYRGLNKFSISFDNAKKGSGEMADQIWLFLRDRLDNHNEPFYFYNPAERLTPDPAGTDPIGRYLVRLEDPNAGLNRSFFQWCLFSYGGLSFIEDRGV